MKQIQSIMRESYIIILLTVLGVLAFISAILIAWPAIAHIASKFQ